MNSMIDPGTSEFPSFMSGQVWMVMRINLDCNSCCRKMRRVLLKMKEIETRLIEKQECRVSVCGRFIPGDVAIKISKKMKRRVEILEIQEFSNIDGHTEQMPPHIPGHILAQHA
ncbi:unnamed protein product [Fraxinus pennsylvanica]|uniref:Uncharacterized protein n=1 Tax=Fraxinus pennsylvanica TaxID=56036 RepID=A0AAD1ZJD1_9LAMI|nr:unnamed protein product [Fraxinus pennsylvanica]